MLGQNVKNMKKKLSCNAGELFEYVIF